MCGVHMCGICVVYVWCTRYWLCLCEWYLGICVVYEVLAVRMLVVFRYMCGVRDVGCTGVSGI